MLELAAKFVRRARRYGLKRTLQKTRAFVFQRVGLSTTNLHWDEAILGDADSFAKHWYDSPLVREAVRARICPPAPGQIHQGLPTWLARNYPGRRFARALSIGCGTAARETDLVAGGPVDHFVCYEVGARLVDAAKRAAAARGVGDKIEFRNCDAFAEDLEGQFDLVFWHHSLHHMYDVEAAVRFSHRALREDGVFLAEEFIGPSRFQWTDANIELINGFRAQLPERFFRRPDFPQEKFPVRVQRPTPAEVIRTDPSEAVQSDDILRAVVKFFPGAEIRMLGGAALLVGVEGIIGNFDESKEEDRAILKEILEIDRQAIVNPAIGSQLAAIMAEKL